MNMPVGATLALAIGLLLVLSFPVKVSALGEDCTDADSSNCTAPSETCSNLVCVCAEGYTEEDSNCRKKDYLSPCVDSTECKGDIGCLNGKCVCPSDHYNSGTLTNPVCSPKKNYSSDCDDGVEPQCRGDIVCLNGKCVCPSDHYNSGTLTNPVCSPKKNYSSDCDDGVEPQCRGDIVCLNGKCVCLSDHYNSGTLTNPVCSPKKNYSSDCDDGVEPQCRGDIVCLNGKCVCPSDHYNSGTLTNPVCSPKKNYSSDCDDGVKSQCRGDIVCLNGKCVCPSDHYNSGTLTNPVCSPRLSHSSPCNPALSPCILGLGCVKDQKNQVDRCLCNPINYSFWTGGANCSSVSSLRVRPTVPSSGRKTTSIELTWSQSVSPAPSDLKYFAVRGSSSTEVATSTTTSHTFTNLTPGTNHSLSIKTVLAKDNYYPERSAISTPLSRYTLPAQPGPVDESKSSLTASPYYVTFGASEGYVDDYEFTITSPTIVGQSTFTLTGTTTTPTLNLKANTEYQYQIIAIRGSDKSEPRIGTFSTDSTRSGPVTNVSVTPQEDSATIRWRKPDSPNGNLTGYSVQVNKNSACQYILLVQCEECNITDGCQINKTEYYRNANLSATLDLEVNLTSLDPYQEYTVNISAFNVKGQGTPVSQSFMTLGAAPQEIKSVTLTPLDRDLNNQVSLKINWTPGKFTGPTNFTLKISRETSLNSGIYEVNSTINVEGYENTEYNKSDVLAYWNYKVEVQAVTENGSSGFVSSSIQKTEPSEPGNIGGLQINQDPKIAAMVDMNLTCPVETKRNGKDWTFVIERDPSFATLNTRSVDAGLCSGSSFYDSEVSVGTNYIYKVRFVNHKYEGNYTESSPVYLKPKAPTLDTVTQVFRSPGESKEKGTSTVNIELKAKDLREISNKQGNISNMALIVCTKFKDNDCNNTIPKRTKRSVTATDLGSYYTYNEASKSGFNIPYRATPNDWHKTVLNDSDPNPSYSYTVGGETNCPTSPRTYCNGPLPDGKDFVFFLVVCNAAGCADYKSGVSKTEAVKEDDSNIGIIVGVVVGALVLIALVVILVVFIMRTRRGRPQQATHHKPTEQMNMVPEKRPIEIREFKQHVERYHRDQNLMFEDQFSDIKNACLRFPYKTEEATRDGNRVKNRYVDILAYDHTRVKLEVMPDNDETMDFINANYIKGFNSVREYIATQGPMHCTIPDFWRMVWEQKCKVIVMLSDLTEGGKNGILQLKVSLYWPENLNEPIHYGDVIVEMTNFSQLNKYIIRNFKVSLGRETRRMTHFFLPGWHDFQANLTFDDVIEFARLVRQEATPHANTGPIVVHCSAGVGRTGTFIALDYFLQYVDKKGLDGEIDIYGFVLEMRRNRPRMVQAEAQYIFIFDAMLQVIERKLQEEKERQNDNADLYVNAGAIDKSSDIYANASAFDQHEYVNSGDASQFVYDNNAFEPDYQNFEVTEKKDTPTTVL